MRGFKESYESHQRKRNNNVQDKDGIKMHKLSPTSSTLTIVLRVKIEILVSPGTIVTINMNSESGVT
jgi:hypothetical protein